MAPQTCLSQLPAPDRGHPPLGAALSMFLDPSKFPARLGALRAGRGARATGWALALAAALTGPWCAPAAADPLLGGMPLAYIGPGAGFAAAGSVLILAGTFLMAIGIVLVYPFKMAVRFAQMRGRPKPKVKRIVVLGLDGFDPELARKYMAEGRMPNLERLGKQGVFSPLETACPSISPGGLVDLCDGRRRLAPQHLRLPDARSVQRTCRCSRARRRTRCRDAQSGLRQDARSAPASWRSLQKSQPFWKLLGARVWSSIIRVPITFPPQPFKNGTLLSGMCVPDIQGTQGSFSFYSTKPRPRASTSAASSTRSAAWAT
jgi:hypothetical protein